MNRNFKKIACFMATALLLTACAQDEMTDGNSLPEGKYPLQIASVSVVGESTAEPWGAKSVQSRVTESSDGGSSTWEWNNNEYIGVCIGNGKPGKYRLAWGSTVDAVTSCYWTSTASDQSVTAWYPAYDEGESGTVNLSDQSKKLEYVLTSSGTEDYNKEVTLSFTHALAKVRVVLTGDQAEQIESVMLNTYKQCTHKQGSIAQISGKVTDDDWVKMQPCNYTTVNVGKCWEANVVPTKAVTNGYKISGFKVKIKDSNTYVGGTLKDGGIEPLAGKINTITLTVTEAGKSIPENGTITEAGNYVVTGNRDTGITINCPNGDVKLTVNNATITSTTGAPILVTAGSPTIRFTGTNTLTCKKQYYGGIVVNNESSSITIEGDGAENSILDIKNESENGYDIVNVGIGTSKEQKCGNITINDIKLKIYSAQGSGIGTSYNSTCGDINIKNATLEIISEQNSVCIGASTGRNSFLSSCGNIIIHNSYIVGESSVWTGDSNCVPAAIGASAGNASCKDIKIFLMENQTSVDDFLKNLTVGSKVFKVGTGNTLSVSETPSCGSVTWYNSYGTVLEIGMK